MPAVARDWQSVWQSASTDTDSQSDTDRQSRATTLLKMTNDIYEAMDDGRITMLVALDMSAAFDTIDHTTLVDRLQHTFGVSGQALRWVASYLHDRSTFVKWNSGQSTAC